MFIRVKTTPNSPRKSVQLVEGYRELGLDRLLSVRHWASRQALFHTVMARIANPRSKRGSVRELGVVGV